MITLIQRMNPEFPCSKYVLIMDPSDNCVNVTSYHICPCWCGPQLWVPTLREKRNLIDFAILRKLLIMCNRFVLGDPSLAGEEYRIDLEGFDWKPNYNIGPSTNIMTIRANEGGEREAVSMQWMLVPSWSKVKKLKYLTVNARDDSLLSKPTWREPFKRSRCLIPNSGFIEWKHLEDKTKEPYLIYLKDQKISSFAGIWDRWRDNETGETLESCAIITTDANELVGEIHAKKRMPVYLHKSEYDEWLDPDNHNTDELQDLLVPYPSEEMAAHKIFPKIGSYKYNAPEYLLPLSQESLFG